MWRDPCGFESRPEHQSIEAAHRGGFFGIIYNTMKVTEDIAYVGVNDHQVDLFEGQYVVPNGMAYNSYIVKDEKTLVFDTVDQHFGDEW